VGRKRNLVQAVGYVRTSSATNVGQDKDSERRQRIAIERFAKQAGFDVVEWFNDPAVSGADPIESRPGFGALIAAAWCLEADARLATGIFVGSLYLFGALGNLWGRRGLHPGWMLMTVALVLIAFGISKPIY
jgi:hypothetical protein